MPIKQRKEKFLHQREVSTSELEKYHYPNTDGGAHNRWKNSLDLDDDDTCKLEEVAKGMLRYSSNANTEYLMDALGTENINERISKLGIEKHDSIYYLVSSLFVKDYLFPEKETENALKALQELPEEDYIKTCEEIHKKLEKQKF